MVAEKRKPRKGQSKSSGNHPSRMGRHWGFWDPIRASMIKRGNAIKRGMQQNQPPPAGSRHAANEEGEIRGSSVARFTCETSDHDSRVENLHHAAGRPPRQRLIPVARRTDTGI